MLERRRDPGQIIELVDKGVEGETPLKMDNEAILRFSDPVRIEDEDEQVDRDRPRRWTSTMLSKIRRRSWMHWQVKKQNPLHGEPISTFQGRAIPIPRHLIWRPLHLGRGRRFQNRDGMSDSSKNPKEAGQARRRKKMRIKTSSQKVQHSREVQQGRPSLQCSWGIAGWEGEVRAGEV